MKYGLLFHRKIRLKKSSELADEQHRLEMVKLATEKVEYFKVSDIEFQLEKPSYTHITLKELSKKYPEHTFQLIIGEDNVLNSTNGKKQIGL
jgi:nicotinate-nucleotide adenylyltransferase